MEAMCLATPVIGSNIRGNRDLLEDGCGILVDLGDTEAIAQAMAQVVTDPQSLAVMAQKAQAKMKHYDTQQIIEQYTKIYHLALKEAK
jgi:glycosyltransferase involved in cell wall biosynthesis